MRRWIGSRKPSSRKPEPVEPPAPPMAGPSGHPAGIDHLMANARHADEIGVAETIGDAYSSLMPVRRLSEHAPALLAAPTAPQTAAAETPDPETPPPETPDPETDGPEADASKTLAPEASHGDPMVTEPDADQSAPADASAETAPPAQPVVAQPPQPMTAPQANPQTLHALARMGYEQKDFEAAAGWWRLLRLGFPHVFHGYSDAALALLELGRFEEGRDLLTEAAPKFPNEPAIPVARATLEERAGDLNAAIDAWHAAMNFPASPWWACLRLAEALEKRGSSDELDAVLRRGCRDARFRAPAVIAKAIDVAVQRQDWPALVERLGFLDVCGDDDIMALDFDAILVPLRDADPVSFDTAMQAPWVDRVVGAAQTDPNRLIRQARLAQLAHRLSGAMASLATLRPNMPGTADAYLRVEAILREAGYPDAADTTLAEAVNRLPGDQDIQARIGSMMEARGDWAGAVAHWTEMERLFPHSTVATGRLGAARAHLPEPEDAPA